MELVTVDHATFMRSTENGTTQITIQAPTEQPEQNPR
jgi:hypothetical protein